MPIYDYVCDKCNLEEEHIEPIDRETIPCGHCSGTMHRIFSPVGAGGFNDDAAWIRSVLEVVSKDSNKPHAVEFRKNPTRENMKRWMKGEGVRHLEPGEYEHSKRSKAEEAVRDSRRRVDFMMKRHMERNTLTVGGR